MGITINPKKRHDEIVAKRESDLQERMDAPGKYRTIEVAFWGEVEDACNTWAENGWRLHTMRDGIRGSGIDMGYRLLFERVE